MFGQVVIALKMSSLLGALFYGGPYCLGYPEWDHIFENLPCAGLLFVWIPGAEGPKKGGSGPRGLRA